jgi:beta-glucosidase-like glycosyl hydrolase
MMYYNRVGGETEVNPYSRIIARLDGERLSREPEVYVKLVRSGIAGFIVFGGDLEKLREGLLYLQSIADLPLIIGSDLEQGLGQQVKGGTVMPSAMAMGSAWLKDPSVVTLIEEAFRQTAREALYVGINTIFAPVMDIQSNPDNPIISIRAFGTEPEIVSYLGSLMIRCYEEEGLMSCAKHFPGHGDTVIDSHHGLPIIGKSLKELLEFELIPFRKAIESNVSMVMMGHLLVPAIDPQWPVSVSRRAVEFLRDMGFGGLIITDALNMGALRSYFRHQSIYTESKAAETALLAGIDLILHPSDPDTLAQTLEVRGNSPLPPLTLRGGIKGGVPDFERGRFIARQIYQKALHITGEIPVMRSPLFVVLDEELSGRSRAFIGLVAKVTVGVGIEENCMYIQSEDDIKEIPRDRQVVLVLFSRPSAFKKRVIGGSNTWGFEEILGFLLKRADLVISFGNPFIVKAGGESNVLFIYDDTEMAQTVVADFLRPFISY